ncbi:phage tail tape measure protein [Clostridium sp. HBUAS56010]|uniref:phage tail tape measure protein n=1 Tax=Clostridium sp. HBUAS56010 TaxID=2571127 RepID=UPI001178C101|nr:phage tail tape measure protein [Clostridium sp. HBUAS56010]
MADNISLILQTMIDSSKLKGEQLPKLIAQVKDQYKLKLGVDVDDKTATKYANQLFKIQNNLNQIDKVTFSNQIQSWKRVNSAAKELYPSLDRILLELQTVNDKAGLTNLQKQFRGVKAKADSLGITGKNLGDTFVSSGRKFLEWTITAGSIMTIIQSFKEMITNVIALDTELIDLKKTTDATSQQLEDFYYNSNNTAKQLGITTKEVISATSAWSRLGYSIKDAETLAKNSAILKSISPDLDITKATDGLVSSLKAFRLEADDSLDGIISKINVIGNTQAVDNGDIVDILTRSSSAMVEANNTLEQTIALGTAATEIVRDSASVGTALKTISMRLRGYDEETQSYTNNIEDLTGKIADLTKTTSTPGGISLFTDNTKETYKSTYQLLEDISKIYDQLTDKDQAQLLEAIAGKRQGQIVAAMLSNFSAAEKSMDSMANSAGGAMQEMEVIYDSVEYKLNRLSQTGVGISQNLFNREDIKVVIDSLNALGESLDFVTSKLGLFGSIGAIGGGFFGIKSGLDFASYSDKDGFGGILSSIKKINESVSDELKNSFSELDVELIKNSENVLDLAYTHNIAKKSAIDFMDGIKDGSIQLKEGQTVLQGYQSYLKSTSTALSLADVKTKALSASMKILSTIGWMAAFTLAAKAIEGVIGLISDYINRVEIAKEAMADAKNNFESVSSELESINKELATNRDRITELNGMSSLTYVEQSELDKLKDATKELERQRDIKNIELKRAAEDLSDANRKAFNEEYGDDNFSYADVEKLNSEYGSLSLSPTVDVSLAQEGLEGIAAALIKIKDAKAEAENSGDDEWINSLTEREDYFKKQLEDNLSSIQSYRSNLTDLMNYRELTSDEQTFYDNLEQGMQLIYQFTDPSAWNQIEFDQVFNTDGIEKTKDELVALAQAGKLDEDTLKGFPVLYGAISNGNLILKDGESVTSSFIGEIEALSDTTEQAGAKISTSLSKQDVIANITSLSEGFESLDKIMSSMKGKNPFDYALLDDKKFKDTFGGLDEAYTDFVEKISSSPKDIKANQEAFDSLLTAWIDGSGVLNNLTEENANLAISMLKNMGVTNAEEVVTNRLAIAHEKLAAEKYYNENASDSLYNATMSEIDGFVNEGIAAGVSEQAMSLLALEKLSVNDIKIDTASDIDQVIALANAAGASTSALDQLARAKAAFASIDSAIAKGTAQLANPSLGSPIAAGLTMATEMLNSNTMAQITEAQKTLEDIENGTYDFGVNLNPDNFKKATYGGGTKTNKAGGKEKTKKDTSEVFDWVSVVIERTKEKVEDLQNQINDTSNWKPKNALTDTAISEMSKQLEALQSQADTYQNEANKYSENLSPTYIDKIKNGTLEIETVTDEVIAKNIKSYQEWYNKAEDVRKQIDDTKKSMQELAKSKLDNIINDFDSLVSLMDKYSSYSESLIQLQEELGESVSDVDYNGLINQQEAIYNELQSKYDSLSKELSKAVSSGAIKVGTEEWRKYQSELVGVNSEMNETVSSINKFRQSMVNLSFQDLEKFADATDRINNGFETMTNLIGSDGLMKDGMITSKGLAQIAIYGKQLSNAKQQTAEYANAIDSLNEMYDNGSLTQSEYNERLNEYTSAQLSAAQATKDAQQAILQFRYDAIQAQIDDMNDLISAKKEALQAEKDYQDYLEEINGKQNDIGNLQKKIDELSLSTDRRDIAQRLQLEADMVKAKEELAKTQADHAFDKTLESLDKQGEEYEKAKNDELDTLKSNTDAQEKVIEDYLGQVKDNYKTVYGTLTQYGTDYNITMTDELTSPWDSAGSAVETFQSAVSDAISQINIDIANIDLSKLTEMVSTMSGFSANGSGASFEDVTSDGTWQKTSKGWWYGNSDDDYVSDGIYTIGGKQYNFNEDGYMKSGWDESSGTWRYFEPENGQMVKSAWRRSKDGKDYYLKSDGSMATDMAVKSKSGDGYYYLNDEGVWDGNLLSYEEVKQRKITVGYKNGTQNSKSGLKYVNEDGPEMIVTKDGTVLNSVGGDTIFPNDMVEKLWSMADNPIKYMLSNMPKFDYNAIPANNQTKNDIKLDVQFNVQGDANQNTLAECKNMLEDYGKKEFPKLVNDSLVKR